VGEFNAQDVNAVKRVAAVAAIFGALMVGCGVGYLLIPTSGADFVFPNTPVPTRDVNPTAPPGQVKPAATQNDYMNALLTDRAALYSASASARLRQTVKVGESFPVALAVCAPGTGFCDIGPTADATPAASRPTDGRELGGLRVGGLVRAELSRYGDDATVKAISPAEQVIAATGDVAEWRWWVRVGSNPGKMRFQISVTSLRGDSEVPLFPTRYFDLDVEVTDTPRNRMSVVVSALNRFFVGVGTGMAALGATIVAYLTYRRGEQDRDGKRATAHGSGGDPDGREAGSFRVEGKRRRRKRGKS